MHLLWGQQLVQRCAYEFGNPSCRNQVKTKLGLFVPFQLLFSIEFVFLQARFTGVRVWRGATAVSLAQAPRQGLAAADVAGSASVALVPAVDRHPHEQHCPTTPGRDSTCLTIATFPNILCSRDFYLFIVNLSIILNHFSF